ncbi:AroM family protein [Desulforhopalus singaporensis]|uniref:Protein AroM n=1 Tax=Desulforhopalus singaporensis TaxID=91360 RepID=A0A1H0RYM5_9BACT|nr:AroM family protein [Desulforhopalus singaporensis]SDP34038.1 protein AroM [Desulforhopalus singaporensis]
MNSNANVLGILTLGQSPRDDVIPSFQELLPPGTTIREAGALDGLSQEQIDALAPDSADSGIETRLAGGSGVMVDKKRLTPLLIHQALKLQDQCNHIILLCSGEFDQLRSACSAIIEPIILLRGIIHGLAGAKILGIIGPASDLALAPAQWQPYARRVVCGAASPYGETGAIIRAGESVTKQGAEIILLDDMGFTEKHRLAVQKNNQVPVVCATTMCARVLTEVMCHANG